MIYRIHRGGTHYTPENTMQAFRLALEGGYQYIETDPRITKDGVVVLMHDASINRTCRNADGSPIGRIVNVRESTYEELMQYDAGIAFSEAFRGTRIPRLEELLTLAEGSGVTISLDKATTDDHLELLDPIMDIVQAHCVRCAFSCASIKRVRYIQARIPDAAFDFDRNTDAETLKSICQIIKPENLIVWLYLNKPNFASLDKIAKTSPENVARVKKFARLGIANLNTPIDVKEALDYAPDVIEV